MTPWLEGVMLAITILALEDKLEGVAGTRLGAVAGNLFGKWPTNSDPNDRN